VVETVKSLALALNRHLVVACQWSYLVTSIALRSVLRKTRTASRCVAVLDEELSITPCAAPQARGGPSDGLRRHAPDAQV
jgi:hypothetical protein